MSELSTDFPQNSLVFSGPVFVGGLDVGLRLLDLNIALSLALSASRGVPTTSEDFFTSPSAVAALYFFGHLITS